MFVNYNSRNATVRFADLIQKSYKSNFFALRESSFVIQCVEMATHRVTAADGVSPHNSRHIRRHGNRAKIPENESLFLCIYRQNIEIKMIYAYSMQNL